ncbi:hypothetical protein ES703_119359 [subsurface metagenome]
MAKRIFTKYMSAVTEGDGETLTAQNALDTWLLQEDIEVIGFQVGAILKVPDQNDNLGEIVVELSQTGVFGQDGVIGQVANSSLWNTLPSGVGRDCSTAIVMFPQGTVIPVKEEGHLYLNDSIRGAMATTNLWIVWAIVYYTKKGK